MCCVEGRRRSGNRSDVLATANLFIVRGSCLSPQSETVRGADTFLSLNPAQLSLRSRNQCLSQRCLLLLHSRFPLEDSSVQAGGYSVLELCGLSGSAACSRSLSCKRVPGLSR